MSREERQIEHILRLLDRTRTMSRMMTDDMFLTVNVSELLGAMEEGGQEWDSEQEALYDPEISPNLTPEMEEHGQVWVWLRGAEHPHWEVRGMGVLMPESEEATGPEMTPEEVAAAMPSDVLSIPEEWKPQPLALEPIPPIPGGWGTCPECEQGKHGNCNGSALNTEDEIDLCACEVAKHRD